MSDENFKFYFVFNQTDEYLITYCVRPYGCSVKMNALGNNNEEKEFYAVINSNWGGLLQVKHVVKARKQVQQMYDKWANKGKPMSKKLDTFNNDVFKDIESQFCGENKNIHRSSKPFDSKFAWRECVERKQSKKD